MRALLLILFIASMASFATSEVYTDVYFRESNITLNYSKIPWILRGVTPELINPQQLKFDTVIPAEEPVRLDPRTCQGEIAICYQIRQHSNNIEITYGKNYTSTSSYILPDLRVKYRYCVGDDYECVRESTNCFCPQEEVRAPAVVFGQNSKCTSTTHICRDTFGTFVSCEGNLSWCQSEYLECGCGMYATCRVDKNNACINDRNELYNCQGSLSLCIEKYERCFCGPDMMRFQNPCTERRHSCERDGKETKCYGRLDQCAVKFDSCTCGVNE